jgi:hypothetical protein
MKFRYSALAVASIAALSPAISNASSERASARACANAFAASLAGSGSSLPYKFAYRASTSSTLADFYPSEFTFTLEAHDPKTGAATARATCSTDFRGTVTTIAALPLGATPATLAASL